MKMLYIITYKKHLKKHICDQNANPNKIIIIDTRQIAKNQMQKTHSKQNRAHTSKGDIPTANAPAPNPTTTGSS